VRRDSAGAFAKAVGAEYRARLALSKVEGSGLEAGMFVCEASEGASVV